MAVSCLEFCLNAFAHWHMYHCHLHLNALAAGPKITPNATFFCNLLLHLYVKTDNLRVLTGANGGGGVNGSFSHLMIPHLTIF